MDLIERARRYASAAHRNVGQLRKYSGQPYEEHLRRVADIVAGVTDDAEMIAAAWLHDVVEDTPTTIEEVGREFGPGVRDSLHAVTDVSRPHHGNRAARKALDRAHFARHVGATAHGQAARSVRHGQASQADSSGFGRVFGVRREGGRGSPC